MKKISGGRVSSTRWTNPASDWKDLIGLLESGEYDGAAAGFRHLQELYKDTTGEERKIILAAAAQICLACAQMKAEEKRCQEAYQDAFQQEHTLQEELGVLVRKMMGWDDARTEVQNQANKVLDRNPGKFLQKHIQKLLGRPHLPVVEKSTPASNLSLSLQAVEQLLPSSIEITEGKEIPPHEMFIFCLGVFQVNLDGQVSIHWPNSKGKSIFKYLVTHREQPVAKEVLMDVFWRDAPPDSARRNLNWSVHSLRQALHKNQPDFSHVLFENECYLLNPQLQVWVDVDDFKLHFRKGQRLEETSETALAVAEYQAAEILYQGDFLEEDRYEDWIFPLRQNLQNDYLSLLDRLSAYYFDQEQYEACVNTCNKMITTDPCREEAHFRLMQCFHRQGFPYLAIRQYYRCVEKLKSELDVPPSPKTTALMDEIRRR